MAKARTYAPDQVIPWEKSALAAMLWVLARSAIRLRAGAIALDLSLKSIRTDWRIVLEQPQRILPTVAIALLLCLLPPVVYRPLDRRLQKIMALRQQQKLAEHQLNLKN